MAKGKVTVKSLRAGQTVYRVCGTGPNASITKMRITSRPYRYNNKDSVLNGTLWVNFRRFYSKDHMFAIINVPEYHDDNFSLRDAGIDGMHYKSFNRTFYTYKAAKRWCEYVRKQQETNWDDDLWSPMDDVEWDDGDPDPAHWHGLNVIM